MIDCLWLPEMKHAATSFGCVPPTKRQLGVSGPVAQVMALALNEIGIRPLKAEKSLNRRIMLDCGVHQGAAGTSEAQLNMLSRQTGYLGDAGGVAAHTEIPPPPPTEPIARAVAAVGGVAGERGDRERGDRPNSSALCSVMRLSVLASSAQRFASMLASCLEEASVAGCVGWV